MDKNPCYNINWSIRGTGRHLLWPRDMSIAHRPTNEVYLSEYTFNAIPQHYEDDEQFASHMDTYLPTSGIGRPRPRRRHNI